MVSYQRYCGFSHDCADRGRYTAGTHLGTGCYFSGNVLQSGGFLTSTGGLHANSSCQKTDRRQTRHGNLRNQPHGVRHAGPFTGKSIARSAKALTFLVERCIISLRVRDAKTTESFRLFCAFSVLGDKTLHKARRYYVAAPIN